MLIATTNELPGYEIEEVFGEVFGLTVRSRNIGSQIGASLKSLIGGEPAGMAKAPAEHDGRPLGAAAVQPCWLHGLYVVPAEWGTGLAARLHDAGVAELRARGCTEARLWVLEENARALVLRASRVAAERRDARRSVP